MKALESIVRSMKSSRLAVHLAALGVIATTYLAQPAFAGEPGPEPKTPKKVELKVDCEGCDEKSLTREYTVAGWGNAVIDTVHVQVTDPCYDESSDAKLSALKNTGVLYPGIQATTESEIAIGAVKTKAKKGFEHCIDDVTIKVFYGDSLVTKGYDEVKFNPEKRGRYTGEIRGFCDNKQTASVTMDFYIGDCPTVEEEALVKTPEVPPSNEPKEELKEESRKEPRKEPCEGVPASYLFTAFAGGHGFLPDGSLDGVNTIPSVIGPLRFIAEKDMRSSGVSFEVASDRVYAEGKFTREVALGKDIFERNVQGALAQVVKQGSLAENTMAATFFYNVPLKTTRNAGGISLVGVGGMDASYIKSTTGLKGASDIHIDRWDGAVLAGLGVKTRWVGTPAVSFTLGPHAYTWGGDAGDSDLGLEFQLRGRARFGPALFDVVYKNAHFTEEANGYTGTQTEDDFNARTILTVWNGIGVLAEYDFHKTRSQTDQLTDEGPKNASRGSTEKEQVRFGVTYSF